MSHRVVITGLGMISALGSNVEENWAALREGRSAIGPIASVVTSNIKFKNGAEVRGFVPDVHFPGGAADQLDRFAQFAVVAAREAVAQAGFVVHWWLSRCGTEIYA